MDFLDRMRTRAQARARGSYLGERTGKSLCFSQHDMNAANASGATVRADYNNALVALATLSSGGTEPSTTFAYQPWADTTSGLMKQRNSSNLAWMVRGSLAETFILARASNTILGLGDYARTIKATSTFTQTLTAAATLGDGWWVRYVNDGTGLITLDPNGSETIDGNTTTTLAAGESCTILCNGASFRTIGRSAPIDRHGQCRLAKSSTNLVLSPRNGNKIVINGVAETIPDAGVSLAATSLTASTLYYVYAYMSSGTMTLEASTTTHATQAGTGVEIKSGDATRTLVGMAQPDTGPAWVDTDAKRWVRSWFNDPGVTCSASFTASRSTTSGTAVELNSEIRCNFLIWSDEVGTAAYSGFGSNSGTSSIITTIGIDGVATVLDAWSQMQSNPATLQGALAGRGMLNGLSEGSHYCTLAGYVGANTGTWNGSGSSAPRTSLNVYLKR